MGSSYFYLPPPRAPLVWDKNNAGTDFADVEIARTNLDMIARRFVMRPMNTDRGKVHPTQKPLSLVRWLPWGSFSRPKPSQSLYGQRHDRRCERPASRWAGSSSASNGSQSISTSPAGESSKPLVRGTCSRLCQQPRRGNLHSSTFSPKAAYGNGPTMRTKSVTPRMRRRR